MGVSKSNSCQKGLHHDRVNSVAASSIQAAILSNPIDLDSQWRQFHLISDPISMQTPFKLFHFISNFFSSSPHNTSTLSLQLLKWEWWTFQTLGPGLRIYFAWLWETRPCKFLESKPLWLRTTALWKPCDIAVHFNAISHVYMCANNRVWGGFLAVPWGYLEGPQW